MEEKTSTPNYSQLEQSLAQRIQVLYLTQVGHKPNQVSCQLLDRTLTITIENPVTQPERLLVESGKQQLAEVVRSNIHKAFQPQLKALIEEVFGVRVIELLGNSNLHTCRSVVMAVLAATPKIVTPYSNIKVKRETVSEEDGEK